MRRFILAGLAALLLNGHVARADTGVNLHPRFVEGRVTRYSCWTQRARVMTVTAAGQDRRADSAFEIEGEITWTVKQVNPDASAVCTMTFDWLTVIITLPDGTKQQNDSRRGSGATPPVQSMISAMCGPVLTFNVTADGTIQSVSGTDAIRSRAGNEATSPEDLDYVETASDLATIPFAPADAVVGKPWPSRFDWLHELGELHYQTTSTLQGVEPIAGIPVAVVNSQSKVDLTVNRDKLPPNANVDIRLLDGSATSQVMFDLSRGEAVGRNGTLATRIESRMSVGQQQIIQVMDEVIQSQALRISEQ